MKKFIYRVLENDEVVAIFNEQQLQALQGVSKVFSDKLSGQSVERPQLQAMLNYIREGDIVIVTELDRLGRNKKN